MGELSSISEALIKGDANKVKKLAEAALKKGVKPIDIINKGLISGMSVVGEKFKKNEFYVPEVLIAARAMHAGMDMVKPLLSKSEIAAADKVVIGTVKGDLHDIGKNLVSMMLEGGGFKVIDTGIDVSPEKFTQAIKESKAPILALSALLTTTMPSMKDTIQALKKAGLRKDVKVMVGGAPLTQKYADEIGADGYAPDASSAVDKAKELMKG